MNDYYSIMLYMTKAAHSNVFEKNTTLCGTDSYPICLSVHPCKYYRIIM